MIITYKNTRPDPKYWSCSRSKQMQEPSSETTESTAGLQDLWITEVAKLHQNICLETSLIPIYVHTFFSPLHLPTPSMPRPATSRVKPGEGDKVLPLMSHRCTSASGWLSSTSRSKDDYWCICCKFLVIWQVWNPWALLSICSNHWRCMF